jgi:hypothetical protein
VRLPFRRRPQSPEENADAFADAWRWRLARDGERMHACATFARSGDTDRMYQGAVSDQALYYLDLNPAPDALIRQFWFREGEEGEPDLRSYPGWVIESVSVTDLNGLVVRTKSGDVTEFIGFLNFAEPFPRIVFETWQRSQSEPSAEEH